MNPNTDMSIEELEAMLNAETQVTEEAKKEYDAGSSERAEKIAEEYRQKELAMRIHLPKLTIGVYADEYSWSQSNQEKDMDELIKHFESVFTGDFTYKRGVSPLDAVNEHMNLYIVDFGGLADANDSEFLSHVRGLHKVIDDKPNTLILFGTNYTYNEYSTMIRHELNDNLHTLPHNVGLMEFGSSIEEDLKTEWVGQVQGLFGVTE